MSDNQTRNVTIEEDVTIEAAEDNIPKRNPDRRRRIAFRGAFIFVGALLIAAAILPWVKVTLQETTFLDTGIVGSASFTLSALEAKGVQAILLTGVVIGLGILASFLRPVLGTLVSFLSLGVVGSAHTVLQKSFQAYTNKYHIISQYATLTAGASIMVYTIYAAGLIAVAAVVQGGYTIWKNRGDYAIFSVTKSLTGKVLSRLEKHLDETPASKEK